MCELYCVHLPLMEFEWAVKCAEEDTSTDCEKKVKHLCFFVCFFRGEENICYMGMFLSYISFFFFEFITVEFCNASFRFLFDHRECSKLLLVTAHSFCALFQFVSYLKIISKMRRKCSFGVLLLVKNRCTYSGVLDTDFAIGLGLIFAPTQRQKRNALLTHLGFRFHTYARGNSIHNCKSRERLTWLCVNICGYRQSS